MALIRCSECGREVSTMATSCPHCGYYTNSTCSKCRFITYSNGFPECTKRDIEVSEYKRSCLGFKEEEPIWKYF